MSSSATGVGMPICFLGAILLILTQKSSQKFGDVLGIGDDLSLLILVRRFHDLRSFHQRLLKVRPLRGPEVTCDT